ncbi:MAG: ABC transporter ATP-binding protein [Candidatus Aegiribacteria sp.]|nr:ABC transporter ATP-binding protein [Candidatus Aegiribacteria sp.]
MDNSIISVSNLIKSYKDIVAVDGISFNAYKGEILGILGPNGSGKTTTLKSILGLILFDSGDIHVSGMDVKKDHLKILRNTGAVLEGARNIYWHLSPEENLKYFAGLRGLSHSHIKERMNILLHELELADVRKKEIREFSKGMKQKVALACAFIHDPEILLLDEPTLGLDVEISRVMRNWLKEVVQKSGKSILVTSHDMDFIESVCDRVLIIKEGRILSHETLQSLKMKFSRKVFHLEIADTLDQNTFRRIEELGELTIENTDNGCRLIILLKNAMLIYDLLEILRSADSEITDFSTVESDLEDIFLNVIKDEPE